MKEGRFCCRCVNQLDFGSGSGCFTRNIFQREFMFGYMTKSILELPDCINKCFYHRGKPLFKSARIVVRRYRRAMEKQYDGK